MVLGPKWYKAKASAVEQCVEAKYENNLIEIRNSKNPDAGSVKYTIPEWLAFIAGVRDGEFDLPEDAV